MKLRFTPNSVRLRLNQTEVAEFATSGKLAERIEFPGAIPNALVYSLRFAGNAETGSARLENGEFTVAVPMAAAKAWASTPKEVGLYYNHELGGGKSLRIAVEKDFQCVDGPPQERDPAAYPNPIAKVGCKTEQRR